MTQQMSKQTLGLSRVSYRLETVIRRHFEHDERYDRAIEFAEIVFGLWDSLDDDVE